MLDKIFLLNKSETWIWSILCIKLSVNEEKKAEKKLGAIPRGYEQKSKQMKNPTRQTTLQINCKKEKKLQIK